MRKRGLELSLTVLVLIILTIIIFISGIALVWRFFASAEEIKDGIEQSTKEQIETLLRQGNELVAIPINTKAVTPGNEAVFGLGIRNIDAAQDFHILTDFAGIYDTRGKALQVGYDEAHITDTWLGTFREQGPVPIERNKYEVVPLRVRAGETISAGQPTPRNAIAAFNVCVFNSQPLPDAKCVIGQTVYDNIHQIFVEIK
jgi:hypothetical protein